jgi:hypothetical protein
MQNEITAVFWASHAKVSKEGERISSVVFENEWDIALQRGKNGSRWVEDGEKRERG